MLILERNTSMVIYRRSCKIKRTPFRSALYNGTTTPILLRIVVGIASVFLPVISSYQIIPTPITTDQEYDINTNSKITYGDNESSWTTPSSIRGSLQPQQSVTTPSTHATQRLQFFDQKRTLESEQRRQLSPSIGNNIRALVLLVQFPEHDTIAFPLPAREYYDTMCNTHIVPYLQKQSYGRYNIIACDVQEWRVTEFSQEFYSSSLSNLVGSEFASDFFIPVLRQLDDNSTDGGISDWTIYDSDQDGTLDAVIAIHSGFGAEYRNIGDCNISDYPHRIHSQGHNDSSGDWYDETTDGYQPWSNYDSTTSLSGYAIASAYDFICTNKPATPGVITHEWIHIFGTPDLYGSIVNANSTNVAADNVNEGRISTVKVDLKVRGLGTYDAMSNARGPLINGFPASLSVYIKYAIGWMEPVEIFSDGTYTLEPAHLDPSNAYVIRHPLFVTDEYLLIEYRAATEYDMDLFGGGLLIYHVDDNQRVQGGSTYPYGNTELHLKVAVIQADGKFDIELGVNNGDDGDYWKTGMVFEPSGVNITKDDLFYPNTDSYYNGPTGLSISIVNITTMIDEFNNNNTRVTIQVTGMGDSNNINSSSMSPMATPEPSAYSALPTVSPSIAPSDIESHRPSVLISDFPSDVPSYTSVPISSQQPSHDISRMPSISPVVTLPTQLQAPASADSLDDLNGELTTSGSTYQYNNYCASTTFISLLIFFSLCRLE